MGWLTVKVHLRSLTNGRHYLETPAWPGSRCFRFQDFLEVSHYKDPPNADYEQFVNTTGYGNGPSEVSRSSGLTGFEIPFENAIEAELGLHEVDLTDGTGIGLDKGVASIFAGNRTRSYGRVTFGILIETRPNVQMIHDAWVSNIGFSPKTAVNVTYQSNGAAYTIKGKEI